MDDSSIIERVKKGDVESFSLLVEKYHRRLLAFIYRLIGDRAMAEDLGQEVFLQVYKSLKDFDTARGTPFSAWLFIAARNRCISELRSRQGKEQAPIEEAFSLAAEELAIDDALIEQEQREALLRSLSLLPAQYRSAITRSLQGASLQEIAEKEGVSAGTVKSRLFRARELMKAFVKEYFGRRGYEGV